LSQIEDNHSLFVFIWVVTSVLLIPLLRSFPRVKGFFEDSWAHEPNVNNNVRPLYFLGSFAVSVFFGYLMSLFIVNTLTGVWYLYDKIADYGVDRAVEAVGPASFMVLILIAFFILLHARPFSQLGAYYKYPMGSFLYAFIAMCFAMGVILPADDYPLRDTLVKMMSTLMIAGIRFDMWKHGI